MAKRSSFYLRKYSTRIYKRRKSLKKIESLAVNIGAAILVLLLLVFAFRFFSGSKKGGITAGNVAAFRLPYETMNEISTLSNKYGIDFPELLTYYALANDFFPDKSAMPDIAEIEQKYIMNYDGLKANYAKQNVQPYLTLVQNLLDEIKYFPIPQGYDSEGGGASYMYGDSWGTERTYGGERTHQGTDIMDRENTRGRIAIVSMTDGVVQNIGWNELGGYRIGIVAESGSYYYYAHFSSYADNLFTGAKIQAGQLLGYMGDTGYSKKEGTTGNFQVHLHVGISPVTSIAKDFWINPYPFLRFVEAKKVEPL